MNKIFDLWKNHHRVSKELKQEMELMNEEEVSVAFNEAELGFGTAGYRAKMGPGNHYLNELTYQQLTEGYARFLVNKFGSKAKALVVHDNRRNAKLFTNIAANTLTSYGIEVFLTENNELLPTPIASYLIPHLGCHGAINITASHNPKEYNGFKCYDETGCQMLPEDSKKVIEFMPTWAEILDKNIVAEPSLIHELDSSLIEKYFVEVQEYLDIKPTDKPIKVVYTSMHGTASKYMPDFIRSLGHECIVVESQTYPDENFTNTPICNPEDPRALEQAVNLANQENVNLIFATDPDADRLGVAVKKDGQWIFLNGNQAGIIETYYRIKPLSEKYSGTPVVISTYISTNLIDRIAKAYNGKVIRTATGFKWVGDQINKLTKNDVYVNGFEEAIGALPTALNRDKDSFQTAALILKIVSEYAEKGMDLIDILEKEIYPTYGHWYGVTTSLIIPGLDWKVKATKMMNQLKTFDQPQILNRKVTKVVYNEAGSCLEYHFENDSWVKFRLSGTEPKFKIYTNLYDDNSLGVYDPNISLQLEQESKAIVQFISNFLGI
ncbi:phospho-sugar mutase [Ureaplasma ceti]|uniref:Phospho-sugar mutase n=1 Tax=Ureaplasma ceti TaxID=3119530 RepID=A0ABP9U608_9BACT